MAVSSGCWLLRMMRPALCGRWLGGIGSKGLMA